MWYKFTVDQVDCKYFIMKFVSELQTHVAFGTKATGFAQHQGNRVKLPRA